MCQIECACSAPWSVSSSAKERRVVRCNCCLAPVPRYFSTERFEKALYFKGCFSCSREMQFLPQSECLMVSVKCSEKLATLFWFFSEACVGLSGVRVRSVVHCRLMWRVGSCYREVLITRSGSCLS